MSTETKKILVPIGFSEQSILALDQAKMFAKALNAEVVLLSVIEQNSMFSRVFSTDEKINEYKKEVKKDLEKIANDFESKSGIKTNVLIAVGTVYSEIAHVAELLNVDMVVMGTNGKPTNFQQKFVGSNAYRVVNSVEPPVVTIKGVELRQEIKSIVFPLILKRDSREKVGYAIKMARLFGASIHILAMAKDKEKAAKLKPSILQVEKFIKDAGINCDVELVINKEKIGVPILEFRKKINGDLIIITEDGEDSKLGLRDTPTEQVIYGADVPVMCITPKHSRYQNQFDSF